MRLGKTTQVQITTNVGDDTFILERKNLLRIQLKNFRSNFLLYVVRLLFQGILLRSATETESNQLGVMLARFVSVFVVACLIKYCMK